MSLLSALHHQFELSVPWLVPSARGWIGIDIGSRAIKMAQVERRGEQFQITGKWIVNQDDDPLSETALTQGRLGNKQMRLGDYRRLFSGSDSAACLSMSFNTLRTIELPAAAPEEMRDMVREELAADGDKRGDDYVFDFWKMSEGRDEASHVTALTTPERLATQIAKDLAAGGYECQILDGLPCAISRAIAMSHGEMNSPIAALDLGDSSFTFVLVANGKPQFTRVLRGSGLRSLMQALRETLNLSHEQAMQLLLRFAVGNGENGGKTTVAGPAQLLMQPLALMVDELKRTLDYIAQQFPTTKPTEMVLLGGGAMIRNLPTHLSERLGIATRRWSLPGTDIQEVTDDALFAVAASLSVLKWENKSCI